MADATDEAAMAAAFEATVKAFRSVDILLANVGTEAEFAPIEVNSVGNK